MLAIAAIDAEMGSFDCVRLPPHYAQEDRAFLNEIEELRNWEIEQLFRN
jgi:hypothetical protein